MPPSRTSGLPEPSCPAALAKRSATCPGSLASPVRRGRVTSRAACLPAADRRAPAASSRRCAASPAIRGRGARSGSGAGPRPCLASRWLTKWKIRKPAPATAAMASTPTAVRAPLMSATARERFMPGCYGEAVDGGRLSGQPRPAGRPPRAAPTVPPRLAVPVALGLQELGQLLRPHHETGASRDQDHATEKGEHRHGVPGRIARQAGDTSARDRACAEGHHREAAGAGKRPPPAAHLAPPEPGSIVGSGVLPAGIAVGSVPRGSAPGPLPGRAGPTGR